MIGTYKKWKINKINDMKYTIELKNEREKNNFVELLKRGMAYCDMYYKQYRAMDNIYENIITQIKMQNLKNRG